MTIPVVNVILEASYSSATAGRFHGLRDVAVELFVNRGECIQHGVHVGGVHDASDSVEHYHLHACTKRTLFPTFLFVLHVELLHASDATPIVLPELKPWYHDHVCLVFPHTQIIVHGNAHGVVSGQNKLHVLRGGLCVIKGRPLGVIGDVVSGDKPIAEQLSVRIYDFDYLDGVFSNAIL